MSLSGGEQDLNTSQLSLRNYNKWSPQEHGATVVWRDLCIYFVAGKNDSLKRIINNSTGAVQPGNLMALMGSSGSGKTTLMSALAFRQPAGSTVQGDILINGRKIGPFMHRISGYVYQDDLFIGSLTVLEHMNFMANLRLDYRLTRYERNVIINNLLESTSLKSLENSRIGFSNEQHVLSGGERKRLAFAVELLNDPLILFCDEPTTGLDSYSAQQIVQILHNLAKKGTTILCTIHQPSSQLFDMFNNVLLLTDGRVAFTGSPQNALKFFAENGFYCPEAYNPADYLVNILSTDPGHEHSTQRTAHQLCDLFAVSAAAKQRDMLVNLEIHMAQSCNYDFNKDTDKFQSPPWYKRFQWLWYRASLNIIREPNIQWYRIIQKLFIALIIGSCFFGTQQPTQLGVQSIQGALFVMISENTFHPMYSVLHVFPQGFPLFMRETRSGMYNTAQYYAANVLAMLPGLILEPFVFVIVCYWIVGLRQTFYAFAITSICIVLVMNVATACGLFFSAAFNSVPMAITYLVPLDYLFMITSGTFIKTTAMPVAFYWTHYLSWMLYANEAMSVAQWQGMENIACFTDNEDLPCYRSGSDVLEKYSFHESNVFLNIAAMCLICIIFHFFAFFCLWRRCQKLKS